MEMKENAVGECRINGAAECGPGKEGGMAWKRKDSTHPVLKENSREGITYLTFPALEAAGGIRHMVSTRTGGVSEGIYASMNYSYTRGDDPAAVDENYRRTAGLFHTGADAFVCSDQTHTTNVRVVTEADRGKGVTRPKDYRDVDGLVTNVPGLILSTFYADCVPLLFVDPKKRVIGCSHSGWRGTAAQMGAVTVETMTREYGCRAADILAAVGPSICRDCYEVSQDVAEEFTRLFSQERYRFVKKADILQEKGNGKYQLDLWKANEAVLLAAGILPEHLSVTDICTCCNPDKLFSHRASHGKRGNFAAFIMLEESDLKKF